MDLNTNILLGTGRIRLRQNLGTLPQIAVEEIDGTIVDMSRYKKYNGKIGHLFVKIGDGIRVSLGKGRLLVNNKSIGVAYPASGSSALFEYSLADLRKYDRCEVYVRLIGT